MKLQFLPSLLIFSITLVIIITDFGECKMGDKSWGSGRNMILLFISHSWHFRLASRLEWEDCWKWLKPHESSNFAKSVNILYYPCHHHHHQTDFGECHTNEYIGGYIGGWCGPLACLIRFGKVAYFGSNTLKSSPLINVENLPKLWGELVITGF